MKLTLGPLTNVDGCWSKKCKELSYFGYPVFRDYACRSGLRSLFRFDQRPQKIWLIISDKPFKKAIVTVRVKQGASTESIWWSKNSSRCKLRPLTNDLTEVLLDKFGDDFFQEMKIMYVACEYE